MSSPGEIVEKFRKYIRIKSLSVDGEHERAKKFLCDYAKEIGLDSHRIDSVNGCEVIIMKWEGKNEELPSLLLSSHYDVVPVEEDKWKYPPFDAHMDEKNDIYGRGTQDMKCVTIMYLESIKRLKVEKFIPERNIYLLITPDEEIGSMSMRMFSESEFFKKMNVGFVFDEGLASPSADYSAYYGERSALWIRATFRGDAGHGSRFIENTAAEKFHKALTYVLKERDEEKKLYESNGCLRLGDYTTTNLTMLQAGQQPNVVPSEIVAHFDCRIPPAIHLDEVKKHLRELLDKCGSDIEVEYINYRDSQKVTEENMNSEAQRSFTIFKKTMTNMKINLNWEIFPAGTDSHYLRKLDIPVIGFSPINYTPILLHDHNERLNSDVLLSGVNIYASLITNLTKS
ncbi:hypothetical protein SNEBB_004576 [Seison nebaliae]|nr:hypothetical protein SNEBB_004576 [Seison nebaliae]